LPWIGYDEAMAHLPQARWMAADARGDDDALSGLRVHDAETAWEAAAAGLGRTMLPRALAAGDRRLAEVPGPHRGGAMTRELWLLSHADLAGTARVAAVVGWLDRLVGATFADR
jgi:DNA-binding transcriptional LysR family regulator